MPKIAFINGSPKREKSSSYYLTECLTSYLSDITSEKTEHFYVSDFNDLTRDYSELCLFDKWVFAFPLYVDALPSPLITFLINAETYFQNQKRDLISSPEIYGLVNCGFFEGHQTRHALSILEHFANRSNIIWRFGIGIGAGTFMKESAALPMKSPIKRPIDSAFKVLSYDLETKIDIKGNYRSECHENILVSPKIPKRVFVFSAHRHWINMAKNNKLIKKDLYQK